MAAKGSPLRNSFGIINGTVRPIPQPGEDQKVVYDGYKKIHALKFQSVTLLNGLIGHLFGPVGNSWFHVGSLSCLFLKTHAIVLDSKFTLLPHPSPQKRKMVGILMRKTEEKSLEKYYHYPYSGIVYLMQYMYSNVCLLLRLLNTKVLI